MSTAYRLPAYEPIRPLSVREYQAMIGAGIFTSEDRLELLQGYLVEKMTKSPAHSAATRLSRLALTKLLGPGWYVETQEPITTSDSEPEPDISVVRGSARDYLDRHPPAAALGLVVEVADTSLRRDRETKGPIYAAAGIPEYWIVNLTSRVVEVYRQPGERGHESVTVKSEADAVDLMLEGANVGTLRVSDLLP